MAGNPEKVRVVVVGDSGVGKTSLVHALAHGEILSSVSWTIGCAVEVMLYEYKEGTSAEKTFFIELWDIGGSANHKNSRSIFYNSINGIILVHDLSNRKSHLNLKRWLSEVLYSGRQELTGIAVRGGNQDRESPQDYDPEQFLGSNLPILIVGTKLDQAPETRVSSGFRKFGLSEQVNADVINLDCLQKKSFSIGSRNWDKFSLFFDKVIERRFSTRDHLPTFQFLLENDSTKKDAAKQRKLV